MGAGASDSESSDNEDGSHTRTFHIGSWNIDNGTPFKIALVSGKLVEQISKCHMFFLNEVCCKASDVHILVSALNEVKNTLNTTKRAKYNFAISNRNSPLYGELNEYGVVFYATSFDHSSFELKFDEEFGIDNIDSCFAIEAKFSDKSGIEFTLNIVSVHAPAEFAAEEEEDVEALEQMMAECDDYGADLVLGDFNADYSFWDEKTYLCVSEDAITDYADVNGYDKIFVSAEGSFTEDTGVEVSYEGVNFTVGALDQEFAISHHRPVFMELEVNYELPEEDEEEEEEGEEEEEKLAAVPPPLPPPPPSDECAPKDTYSKEQFHALIDAVFATSDQEKTPVSEFVPEGAANNKDINGHGNGNIDGVLVEASAGASATAVDTRLCAAFNMLKLYNLSQDR